MCRAVPEQKLVPAQSACRRSQSCSAQNRAKQRNISALRKTEQNSAKTLLCTKQSKTAQKVKFCSVLCKTEQNRAKSEFFAERKMHAKCAGFCTTAQNSAKQSKISRAKTAQNRVKKRQRHISSRGGLLQGDYCFIFVLFELSVEA